jgi:hypothetical protein
MTRIVHESHSRSYHPDLSFVTVASTCWPICNFDWSYDLQVLPSAIKPQPVTIDFEPSNVTEQVPSAWHSLLTLVTRPLITCGFGASTLFTCLLLTYSQTASPATTIVITAIAATMGFLCFMPSVYNSPSDRGLRRHFGLLSKRPATVLDADAFALRCGVKNASDHLVFRLAV